MIRSRSLLGASLALALLVPAPVLAAKTVLAIQGRLTNVAGSPVADGTYPFAFALHEADTGGVPVYNEMFLAVPVSGGLFAVQLGATPLASLDDALFLSGKAHWVGVTVAGDPELPRVPLRPVAYALSALSAGKAADLACSGCVLAGAIAAGAVGTDTLAPGAVTGDKIAAGTINASHVAFTFAASDGKGGEALAAKMAANLDCTGCVEGADLAPGAVTGEKLAPGSVSAAHVDGTFISDLGLPLGKDLSSVAFSGKYSDLQGGPDLSPYAKTADLAPYAKTADLAPYAPLAAANTWPKLQTFGAGILIPAVADPAACDGTTAGLVYFNTKTLSLRACDGKKYYDLAVVGEIGSETNPALSCKELKTKKAGATDGTYWIAPGGGPKFQVFCDMTTAGGGWTLCLSNVERGKGVALADTNEWWISQWDKGSRVLTRGNKGAGTAWGNFCKLLMPDATQIYATVYSESNVATVGDVCTLDSAWFNANSGYKKLGCGGSTAMAAIPKNGFQNQGCTGCIFWSDETAPNASGTVWGHNYYGTHVMVRLKGASAYGDGGIHWGNVNSGMTEGNAGDVQCGSKASWCYEPYWGGNTSAKSMQFYVR